MAHANATLWVFLWWRFLKQPVLPLCRDFSNQFGQKQLFSVLLMTSKLVSLCCHSQRACAAPSGIAIKRNIATLVSEKSRVWEFWVNKATNLGNYKKSEDQRSFDSWSFDVQRAKVLWFKVTSYITTVTCLLQLSSSSLLSVNSSRVQTDRNPELSQVRSWKPTWVLNIWNGLWSSGDQTVRM